MCRLPVTRRQLRRLKERLRATSGECTDKLSVWDRLVLDRVMSAMCRGAVVDIRCDVTFVMSPGAGISLKPGNRKTYIVNTMYIYISI